MNAKTLGSQMLFMAAEVAETLESQGVEVLAHYSNGRKPVLIIDKPPQFVRGVVRRRQPDGQGGTEYVLAAPYNGLQIEWTERFGRREVSCG